jgi:hypothetical protein
MSIKRESSGFYEWHDHVKGVPGLGVETARIDECVAYYHEQGFRGLFGHEGFGFRQANLDFLARTNNAKWLWFWDVSLKNIDPIYELSGLELVGIHPKRPGIDFSRFPVLRTAINHWLKSDMGISQSTITEYHLWHYNPSSKSFDGLEIPKGVKELQLCWANPAALDGLPVMTKLKVLEIHRCRNLEDLSALPRIAPNLQKLLTTTSSRIVATAGVVDHPKLTTALMDGRCVVGTGG